MIFSFTACNKDVIEDLEKQVVDLEEEVEELEDDIKILKKEKTEAVEKKNKLEKENKTLSDSVDTLEKEKADLEEKVIDLEFDAKYYKPVALRTTKINMEENLKIILQTHGTVFSLVKELPEPEIATNTKGDSMYKYHLVGTGSEADRVDLAFILDEDLLHIKDITLAYYYSDEEAKDLNKLYLQYSVVLLQTYTMSVRAPYNYTKDVRDATSYLIDNQVSMDGVAKLFISDTNNVALLNISENE